MKLKLKDEQDETWKVSCDEYEADECLQHYFDGKIEIEILQFAKLPAKTNLTITYLVLYTNATFLSSSFTFEEICSGRMLRSSWSLRK